MTTYIYWPGSLPLPLQSGYQHEIAPSVLRTDMTDGHVRQRLLNANAPDSVSVTVQVDREQLAVFREFWRSDLACGTESFVIRLLNAGTGGDSALENRLVRIQKGAYSMKLVQRNDRTTLWQIGLKLDVFGSAAVDDPPDGWGGSGDGSGVFDGLVTGAVNPEFRADDAVEDADLPAAEYTIEKLDLGEGE